MNSLRGPARVTAGVLVLVVAAWLAWGRVRARLETPAERSAADTTRLTRRAPSSEHGPLRLPAAAPSARRLRGVVRAREVDAWTLRFPGGRPARVWVAGDGDASLDCVAQDGAGNLLDVQARGIARCHLRWSPARTGSYRIMIRNSGSTPSAYQLVTY